MQLIDLSHTIEAGMPLFSASAPAPVVTAWQSHAQAAASGHYQGCTCEISQVSFVTSLGTYLDSPYHFHPGMASIEKLSLDQLVLPGVVIDCTQAQAGQPIRPEVLEGAEIEGKAVLFHTGWSRFWRQPAYLEFPYLSAETAQALIERKAKIAGVDFLVIDNLSDPRRPVHVGLLKNNILIVENLTNLSSLGEANFTFHAVPVKFAQAAAFPVRAYAVLV
jgi:arylformamidase